MNLRIEEPCHESWNAMSQKEKGRHCDKCCKTVFDFTNMPTEEVIQFIASNIKGSICGRFTGDQVTVPANVKKQLAVSWTLKKFLAAVVLVFGGALFTGCGNTTVGEPTVKDSITATTGIVVAFPDTISKNVREDTVPQKADTTIRKLHGKVECVAPPKEVEYINGGVTIEVPEVPTFVGLTVIDDRDLRDTAK